MTVIFIRTLLLYLLMTAAVRLMGKRQVGELQPLELVVTIIISNIASLPLEHPSIPLFISVVPVLTLVALEVVMSAVTLKCRRLRRMVSGSPIAVIYDGQILQDRLEELRFSVDDLMEELRSQSIFDLADVQVAIAETNGKLSICKRPEAETLTPKSLSNLDVRVGGEKTEYALRVSQGGAEALHEKKPRKLSSAVPPPFVAVADGQLEHDSLRLANVGEEVVRDILQQEQAAMEDVLLLTIDLQNGYQLVKKERKTK